MSITFCSLVSTAHPFSSLDRNCLLYRIPNKIPFCKGKNPSFPFKRDPPFRSEEREDAWSKDGHPREGLRVGLGAAGAAQGWFVSLLLAQESRQHKAGKSWPACVVKLSPSDSSRWGPHGALSKSAANEPNPLILCLQ